VINSGLMPQRGAKVKEMTSKTALFLPPFRLKKGAWIRNAQNMKSWPLKDAFLSQSNPSFGWVASIPADHNRDNSVKFLGTLGLGTV